MFDRVKDVALLLGRIGVAVVFFAHGLQKWDSGVGATAGMFDKIGIPLPTFAAIFVIVLEVLGSIAFVAGFLLPLITLGYVIDMVGALVSVHGANGLTGDGGYELVLVLGLAALALGLNGGRLSLDHVLFWRRREARLASTREFETA
ncbi:DoxX family protein [Amycolatopsis jiangsuensis]|uniref:Putative oxidoreductase n=1 Tax=Amycolatopsis jiangsuensis TaxID=1181879 RepID=A0A840IY62_9PSEU|nr:DoxX family protein [Amycolatopsis jiangsuensis]MBB4686142.1 putative oxidoreductase [Amycolatopsis jiangsuensis]